LFVFLLAWVVHSGSFLGSSFPETRGLAITVVCTTVPVLLCCAGAGGWARESACAAHAAVFAGADLLFAAAAVHAAVGLAGTAVLLAASPLPWAQEARDWGAAPPLPKALCAVAVCSGAAACALGAAAARGWSKRRLAVEAAELALCLSDACAVSLAVHVANVAAGWAEMGALAACAGLSGACALLAPRASAPGACAASTAALHEAQRAAFACVLLTSFSVWQGWGWLYVLAAQSCSLVAVTQMRSSAALAALELGAEGWAPAAPPPPAAAAPPPPRPPPPPLEPPPPCGVDARALVLRLEEVGFLP